MIKLILKLLDEKNISKTKFAFNLGVIPQIVNNWIVRDSVPKKYIPKIAEILDISMDNLLLGRDSLSNTFNFDLLDVQASAGTGVALLDESVVQSISIDKDKFQELFKCAPTDSMKIINIKGDSMTPTFKDNDFILVDIANITLSDGVFVFRVNDELYVKRLQRLPNKVVALSDNSNYIPFDLPENTEIVARVVCAWQFNSL
jgi:hypothetical protein